MTPRLIVLDLDGTLVRLAVDWGALRARLGVASVWSALPAHADAVTRAEVDGAARCAVNAALVAWLSEHHPATPRAVLSLNAPEAVRIALERAGVAVGAIVGRGQVEHPKPHPEGLLRLAALHSVGPGETLMIGDRDSDLACAHAAGASALHVSEIGIRWTAQRCRRSDAAGNVPRPVTPAPAEPSSTRHL